MKNFLVHKDKYTHAFCDGMYRTYRKLRYGIGSVADTDLAAIRSELVHWQEHSDRDALLQTTIQYRTWLAVDYEDQLLPRGGAGYITASGGIQPSQVGLSYNIPGADGQNIIQVNAGGCITRINLSPNLTINNGNSYVFEQTTPARVWEFSHGLGIRPNIRLEDNEGTDIEGDIEYLDNNRVRISFSQPVSGKAFLS